MFSIIRNNNMNKLIKTFYRGYKQQNLKNLDENLKNLDKKFKNLDEKIEIDEVHHHLVVILVTFSVSAISIYMKAK
jgi:Flp pilus assembly CpaF family ATPase